MQAVAVGLACGGVTDRRRDKVRELIGVRNRVKAEAEIGALPRGVAESHRAHHGRLARFEDVIGQAGTHVEHPQPVSRHARAERAALKVASRIQHQHQWRDQVVVGDVGDFHFERQRAV